MDLAGLPLVLGLEALGDEHRGHVVDHGGRAAEEEVAVLGRRLEAPPLAEPSPAPDVRTSEATWTPGQTTQGTDRANASTTVIPKFS